MSRLVPHPLLSLGLVVIWLLLTRFSLGHLLLGTAIALIAGRALLPLEPAPLRLRRIGPLLRLAGIVAGDIVRANIAVARLILSEPGPLPLLAMIITATPGTAWLEHDRESGILLLHVFDLVEPEDWVTLIRDRYESLLMEAFA